MFIIVVKMWGDLECRSSRGKGSRDPLHDPQAYRAFEVKRLTASEAVARDLQGTGGEVLVALALGGGSTIRMASLAALATRNFRARLAGI